MSDMVEDLSAERLRLFREARSGMMRAILSEAELADVLELTATAAESLFEDCSVAVALIDTDGSTLLDGASPSLPPELSKALHHLKLPVDVQTERQHDLRTHPNWAPYRKQLEAHGYLVHWSYVIRDLQDRAMGYLVGVSTATPNTLVDRAEERLIMLTDLTAILLHQSRTRWDLETTKGRLAALVENSPAIVAIKDVDGRYVLVSKALEEIFGVTAEEMIGRDVSHVFGEPVAGSADALRLQALEKKAPARGELEVRGRCLDAVYFPLTTPRGTLYGAAVIALDVTERKRSEERMKQAAKRELASQLASGIAHDFNNILHGIGMAAHAGDDEDATVAEMRSALEAIKSMVARAGTLTERLLTLAAPTTPALESVDVVDVVSSIAPLLEASARGKTRVRLDLAPGVPRVKVDRADLERALVNLVVNARDAVREDGCIVVSCRVADTDPSEVHLSVSDDGHGMDAPTTEKALEPFFTTKSDGSGGFGLGLAVVQGVALDAGGRVHVESEVGKGTTVHLYLPGV